MERQKKNERIVALDFLRGFFIVAIIVDHLWRWPNLFEFISGRGEMWTSAAEGFVVISGLLVGYIRGYKDRHKPMRSVTKKLITRGLMLYIWSIITTLLLVAASWLLSFRGDMAYVPIAQYDWRQLFHDAVTLDYEHTLTHFLYLYAIFLIISPVVVWLLRRGYAWLVAIGSVLFYMYGWFGSVEWLQWQIVFFLPACLGFYLEDLLTYYRSFNKRTRNIIRLGFIVFTGVTVVISLSLLLPKAPGVYHSAWFGRDPLTLPTALLSFAWFFGLLSLFQYLVPWLKIWLGWLLLTFGERSLTAYILHTIPLVICALILPETHNLIVNTILTAAVILATWLLVRIPHVNKLIPR